MPPVLLLEVQLLLQLPCMLLPVLGLLRPLLTLASQGLLELLHGSPL